MSLSTSGLFFNSSGFSQTEVLVLGLKKKTRPSPVQTTHHGVPGTGVLETGRLLSLGFSSFSFGCSLAGSDFSSSVLFASSFFVSVATATTGATGCTTGAATGGRTPAWARAAAAVRAASHKQDNFSCVSSVMRSLKVTFVVLKDLGLLPNTRV